MLYYVFTVDGDWDEYFDTGLPEEKRLPEQKTLTWMIKQETAVARELLSGKFLYFIHTSPRAREYFLQDAFVKLFKKIIAGGGDVGLHCHEDDPGKNYYSRDIDRMLKVISSQMKLWQDKGIKFIAYRSGYMSFNAGLIPILEENGLEFDFSCIPGRYLIMQDQLVSDWRGAPVSLYRLDYKDHRCSGDSKIYEVPIGMADGQHLYLEKVKARELDVVALGLSKTAEQYSGDMIVSVLTHNWDFASEQHVEEMKQKIAVLKKYGTFINLNDLRQMIK